MKRILFLVVFVGLILPPVVLAALLSYLLGVGGALFELAARLVHGAAFRVLLDYEALVRRFGGPVRRSSDRSEGG